MLKGAEPVCIMPNFGIMKRVVAILIAILYLSPSIGYSIDIQWCCNKISGISFSPAKIAKCNVCETPRHCCKHTHIEVKLKDSQHGSVPTKISANTTGSPIQAYIVLPFSSIAPGYSVNYRPPPLAGSHPIYLKTTVLRV